MRFRAVVAQVMHGRMPDVLLLVVAHERPSNETKTGSRRSTEDPHGPCRKAEE